MERATLATVTPSRPPTLREALYDEGEAARLAQSVEQERQRQVKYHAERDALGVRLARLLNGAVPPDEDFNGARESWAYRYLRSLGAEMSNPAVVGPVEVRIDGITFAAHPDHADALAVWLRADAAGINYHRTIRTRAELAALVHDADERFPY